MPTWIIVLGSIAALIIINAGAFVAFYWDKWCAENRRWRIPEMTLLFLAMIGGSIGAITAQQILRHKTRKEPFRTLLYGIATFQAIFLAGLLFGYLRMVLR